MIQLTSIESGVSKGGGTVVEIGDSGLKTMRKITNTRCEEFPENSSESFWLDLERARFIDKKRNLAINKSYLLGRLWLVLDPLFISLVYLFVFSVIRHRTDPGSIFVGLVLIRTLTECLKYGAVSHMDFTAGLKIERIRTRAIIMSEVIHVSTKSFFLCLGGLIVCLSLGASPWLIVALPILNIFHALIWYSFGRLLSPIISRYRDLQHGIAYLSTLIFFGSPALYPITETSGIHREINLYNPFVFICEPLRGIAFQEQGYKLLDSNVGIVLLVLSMAAFFIGIKSIDRQRWRTSIWTN